MMAMASGHKETTDEFYHDVVPYTPRLDQLPTNDDITRFYVTHMKTKKDVKNVVIRNAAKMLLKIWKAGDCCPKSENRIIIMIEELLKVYWKYKAGHGRSSGKHKKKEDAPVQSSQPTRRSKKLNSNVSLNLDAPEIDANPPINLPSVQKKARKSQRIHVNPRKQDWMTDFGSKTFDVVNAERKMKFEKSVEEGKEPTEYFDLEFYKDQMKERIRYIETSKVTKEFQLAEQEEEQHATRVESRRLSALGKSLPTHMEDQYESSTVSSQTSESTPNESNQSQPIPDMEPFHIVETRSKKGETVPKTFESRSTQSGEALILSDVDFLPSISTRMNKNGRACHPRYLQAGLLMMALNNQSSRQAVMNMFIMDTVVYKQKRKLPIRLRKDYQRQLQFLKKYASMSDTNGKENDIITQIGPGSINLLNEDSTQNDGVTEQWTYPEQNALKEVIDEAGDIDFNITTEVIEDVDELKVALHQESSSTESVSS